ncbi:MAG TPA: type II CAAX endopeptidase family protein [Thermoanaerobaculia bacterium]|jgi:membrane protease YdiL (CAAX protease family)|nr:type II CAAX endopeptidase family protein [Thermoanaerobaculia bacterium]
MKSDCSAATFSTGPDVRQGGFWQLVAALSLFVALYLASFFVAGYLTAAAGAYFGQWVSLLSVCAATIGTIGILEHGLWPLGFFVRPALAVREMLFGCSAAVLLIGAADGLVMLTSRLRHVAGNGFPWLELVAVFLPAVFHEELLFRGYPFQKIWRTHRLGAVLFSSVVFAALHSGNNAVSLLAMTNLFLAGILLALAYARYERLWFPIGIHLGWNLLSGPILGYNVSGYASSATVLRTIGRGSPWLTGGMFGIEGSVWIVVVELAGIALLLPRRRHL